MAVLAGASDEEIWAASRNAMREVDTQLRKSSC
jgi:hypothetical protein